MTWGAASAAQETDAHHNQDAKKRRSGSGTNIREVEAELFLSHLEKSSHND